MTKKGQVTIYIIVGILILIIVSLLFFFRNEVAQTFQQATISEEFETDLINIYDGIESCLEINLQDAILEISLKGGYYELPNDTYKNSIPYYYGRGRVIRPSLSIIESEIGKAMDDIAEICLSFVSNPKYRLESEVSKTLINIEEGEVIADIVYPISVIRENSEAQVENDYQVSTNTGLYQVYKISGELVEDLKNNPTELDITKLSSYEYPINLLPDGNNLIYAINFDNYTYMFAVII